MADFSGVLVPYGPPVVERVVSVYDGVLVLPQQQPAPTLPRFRAQLAGEYVYFTGAPPVGATDIVIVSVPC